MLRPMPYLQVDDEASHRPVRAMLVRLGVQWVSQADGIHEPESVAVVPCHNGCCVNLHFDDYVNRTTHVRGPYPTEQWDDPDGREQIMLAVDASFAAPFN